ncbi:MAG TPA: TssQ family T6SS-associated lipoprotein [Usitatibacter sp.]|nr:TssQ family T6SS-associated lipoprotein [Usitatibacter sp.]
MSGHLQRVRIAGLVCMLLLAAGCAQMQELLQKKEEAPSRPAVPQISEDELRSRAQQQLADGVKQYDSGEYEAAIRSLGASLDHGLLSKADQSRARKYLAFSYCVTSHEPQCRAEFRKAFEINPDFTLSPAEDGHPIWGPVYRSVRTQLISEREATQPRPFLPLGKAEQLLRDGLMRYEAGEYMQAEKLLDAAVVEGLKDKADQVKAMKHIAFSLCLRDKWRDCRTEFVRIYDIDPNFDLTPAEAGHPSWTKTFASAKAQAKRMQAAREKKDRAAPENQKK